MPKGKKGKNKMLYNNLLKKKIKTCLNVRSSYIHMYIDGKPNQNNV